MIEEQPVPIPVRLMNPEALAGAMPRPKPRRRITSRYRTFVLNSANGWILPVGGEDLSRAGGWVIAYGNSVMLCESQAQAQDPFNTAPLGTATGFTATPANPAGMLLYVPTGAGQVPASVRWRLESNDVIWASAAYLTGTNVALLGVAWDNRAEGY